MALFGLKGFKKKTDNAPLPAERKARATSAGKPAKSTKRAEGAAKEAKEISTKGASFSSEASAVIKHPRVTEKGTVLSETTNAYVFDVAAHANKHQIAEAVKALYGVTAEKVRTIPVPYKTRFVRGKWGTTGGGKKAVVYLKKGDKIETN